MAFLTPLANVSQKLPVQKEQNDASKELPLSSHSKKINPLQSKGAILSKEKVNQKKEEQCCAVNAKTSFVFKLIIAGGIGAGIGAGIGCFLGPAGIVLGLIIGAAIGLLVGLIIALKLEDQKKEKATLQKNIDTYSKDMSLLNSFYLKGDCKIDEYGKIIPLKNDAELNLLIDLYHLRSSKSVPERKISEA